jgi:hypothetical protein
LGQDVLNVKKISQEVVPGASITFLRYKNFIKTPDL